MSGGAGPGGAPGGGPALGGQNPNYYDDRERERGRDNVSYAFSHGAEGA